MYMLDRMNKNPTQYNKVPPPNSYLTGKPGSRSTPDLEQLKQLSSKDNPYRDFAGDMNVPVQGTMGKNISKNFDSEFPTKPGVRSLANVITQGGALAQAGLDTYQNFQNQGVSEAMNANYYNNLMGKGQHVQSPHFHAAYQAGLVNASQQQDLNRAQMNQNAFKAIGGPLGSFIGALLPSTKPQTSKPIDLNTSRDTNGNWVNPGGNVEVKDNKNKDTFADVKWTSNPLYEAVKDRDERIKEDSKSRVLNLINSGKISTSPMESMGEGVASGSTSSNA